MTKTDQRRFLFTIAGLAVCIYTLWPTFRFYAMSPAQRQEVLQARPSAATNDEERERLKELADLRDKAIRLGLDLQGGMYLLLEVDKSKLGPAEARNAVDQARQIIENRIDQFGVAEPLIQKQGDSRILIQLPGLLDQGRAKELIGQTALLEFKLVKTDDEQRAILDRMDKYFAAKAAGAAGAATPDSLARPLTSRFMTFAQGGESFVLSENVAVVEAMLAQVRADSAFALDGTIAWGAKEDEREARTGRSLFILSKEPLMQGKEVQSAQMRLDLDQARPGAPGVSFTLTSRGGSMFADITGANVGRSLAIVLDNRVQSAPNIQERIPRGQGSITGNFTEEEAQNLAIVLRSGALPAPVSVVEERTVGASLGQDSIQKGLMAGAIGAGAVILFMLVYYQLSGLVAVVALILNIIGLLACMAGFHSTLTLPGIAGIVLTIGMAVDANVLVFERIREELRNKKTVLAAIETGYSRAWRTILDAHVTILLSSLALMWFGSGPIRGFAVTLSIGLIINMITAIFVSKMIFDTWSLRRKGNTISI